jgi:hypothetical protein
MTAGVLTVHTTRSLAMLIVIVTPSQWLLTWVPLPRQGARVTVQRRPRNQSLKTLQIKRWNSEGCGPNEWLVRNTDALDDLYSGTEPDDCRTASFTCTVVMSLLARAPVCRGSPNTYSNLVICCCHDPTFLSQLAASSHVVADFLF